MPLRDHFHPPLSLRKGWAGVHHSWAVTIVQRLNRSILSQAFESEPEVHLGTAISIDVASYESEGERQAQEMNGTGGGVATAEKVYVAPIPTLSGPVAFTDPDLFEVQIYKQSGGYKLVAAIELVSPANKDRPAARRAFATKVASYLQQGVSVVTVDVVTERLANLHDDLVELLHLPDHFDWQPLTGLSAMSYRVVKVSDQTSLEVWPFELTLGAELPIVPLWLEPTLSVPLELELTYTSACESLRIT